MRVLITGGAGFLGSHLAERFLAGGHEVVGIDNLSTGRKANWPKDAELVVGDIRNLTTFWPKPWDVIYHCAASYRDRGAWEADATTNVLGTINVVRLAQHSGAHLVYFQTSLCYGPKPVSPVKLDAPLDPHGSYAVSKTAGEAYIRDSGIPFTSLRLANIYGPRNLSGPVPTFYQRLTTGKPCTVVRSRRDFVYVEDLIRVAAEAWKHPGIFHVASGRDYPIITLYQAVVEALGVAVPEPTTVPRGADDVATLLLDASLTQATFDWMPVWSLREGVREAVRWYRDNPKATETTYSHLSMATEVSR